MRLPRMPGRISRRISRRRALLLAPAALLVLAVLVVEGRSWLLFHTLAPWSSPPQIHYCGRDYLPGPSVDAPVGPRLTHGPLWQPVYGQRTPAAARASGGPCAMILYLRAAGGYREYVLSGGP